MSRFSRLFASGSSLRFASVTVAATLASLFMLPSTVRAQGSLIQAPSANFEHWHRASGRGRSRFRPLRLDRHGRRR